MKPSFIAAILAASALAITGGCASIPLPQYRKNETITIHTVLYGTIESVRLVRISEDHAPVGTIAGAVAGGFAGNAIEHHVTEQNGEELVVRLEDGKTIAVVQAGMQRFERGQRVRVITGPKGSRVEHA